ncbi:MAG: hypothetical protein Q9209_005273 [Squamulea sp. 1 TL-2023]
MAEVGIISLIVQIADVGLRLSLRLYTFGETIASADGTISSISKDVSLTSTVLKELGCNLEKDKEAQICSETAIKTAEDVVQECLKVFQEIDAMLEKTVASSGSSGEPKAKWTTIMAGKLKWPFLQPKMQLLRSNLDKLKITLLLMLNVMTYARQLTERTQPDPQLEHHRKLIEDLARSKDEYTRKFDVLTRAIMDQSSSGLAPEYKSFPFFTEAQEFPVWPSTPSRQDESNRILYQLKTYGGLINSLLQNIQAVENNLEPLLGARIRDDIIFTHRRETRRFECLHGRTYLQRAINGVAWDMIESELRIQGEVCTAVDPFRTYDNLVQPPSQGSYEMALGGPSDSNLDRRSPQLSLRLHHHNRPDPTPQFQYQGAQLMCQLHGMSPTQKPSVPTAAVVGIADGSRRSRKRGRLRNNNPRCVPASQNGRDEVSTGGMDPLIPGLDFADPANVPSLPLENLGHQWGAYVPETSGLETFGVDSGPQVDTLPPSHSRARSISPNKTRSFAYSPSAEVGLDESEMCRADPELLNHSDFDISPRDKWLSVANVASIMKDALPKHAKISKDAKESMQECVSEFISFITSEGMGTKSGGDCSVQSHTDYL